MYIHYIIIIIGSLSFSLLSFILLLTTYMATLFFPFVYSCIQSHTNLVSYIWMNLFAWMNVMWIGGGWSVAIVGWMLMMLRRRKGIDSWGFERSGDSSGWKKEKERKKIGTSSTIIITLSIRPFSHSTKVFCLLCCCCYPFFILLLCLKLDLICFFYLHLFIRLFVLSLIHWFTLRSLYFIHYSPLLYSVQCILQKNTILI